MIGTGVFGFGVADLADLAGLAVAVAALAVAVAALGVRTPTSRRLGLATATSTDFASIAAVAVAALGTRRPVAVAIAGGGFAVTAVAGTVAGIAGGGLLSQRAPSLVVAVIDRFEQY